MIMKEKKRYVGSWLGGFEWAIFVGVGGFAYGKTGANVAGRSGVVCVEQCIIVWLSRYLVVRLRKRCAGVRGR